MNTATVSSLSAAVIASNYITIDKGKDALNGSIQNVWGQLVQFASTSINGTNSEHVAAYLADTVEVEIVKQQAGVKSKPGAYRSAKSVLCKAVQKGVPLFEADGSVRGKTAVEKDIKEAKTPEEKVEASLRHALKLLTEEGVPVTAEHRLLIAQLASLIIPSVK